MSSPIRRTNSRPSPSRNTPNGFRRSQANGNGVHSPYRTNLDSPSRLIEEFSKVYIDDEKAFRKRLDEQADEQERLHRQALEQSLKEHEQVRQSAERAREKLQFEIQRMKVQRAEDERIALDKERQRTVEAEAAAKQRELEAVQRREEALQQAAQKQREVEEAQRRIDVQKKQVEEDKAKREAERTQREEADRKSREDAAANERAIAEQAARKAAQPAPPAAQPKQQTPTPAPQTNGVHAASSIAAPQAQGTTASVSAKTDNGVLSPTGILTPMQEREAEHKRYMDLHKQLKVMRSETLEQAQQLGFKAQLGNMRRDIKKVMGQLNKVDKTANKPHVSGQSSMWDVFIRS
jgi:nucleoporin GLE1